MRLEFEKARHRYTVGGVELPSITQMLDAAGLTDSRWYTEASRVRGTAIHRLTEDYDLDAVELARCESPYLNYLLSHIGACRRLRVVEFLEVELAAYHPVHGFAGRPDRVFLDDGWPAILEGKSGEVSDAHNVQTALQAILIAPKYRVEPAAIRRYCVYWRDTGVPKVYEHPEARDLERAYRVLRTFGKGVVRGTSNQLQATAIGKARSVPQADRAQGPRGRGKGQGTPAR